MLVPSCRRAAVCGVTLIAAAAAGVRAAAAQPARPVIAQTLAVNPLALPFGAVSAEYERALGGNGFAFGVGGTATFTDQFDLSEADDRYASAQAKLKYYPAERGLRGFSVGVTAGLVYGRDRTNTSSPYYDATTGAMVSTISSAVVTRSATAPTLGAVLDYNWLIGRRRRFVVGLGVGARRVLGSSTTRDVVGDVLPDGRLVVGYGF